MAFFLQEECGNLTLYLPAGTSIANKAKFDSFRGDLFFINVLLFGTGYQKEGNENEFHH